MTEPYYQDDAVVLYHGDCLELANLWTGADVLVTDPPYGMDLLLESRFVKCAICGAPSRSRRGTCAKHKDRAVAARVSVAGDGTTDARDRALEAWGAERPAIVFGTWKASRPAGTRHVAVWDHGSHTPPGDLTIPWAASHDEIYVLGTWPKGGRRRHGVIRVQALVPGQHARPDHPTPKPIPLMERLIEACPAGAIADPFAGAGATLIAAKNLGRRVIGVELDERYCEIAAKRLAQGVLDFGATA